MNPFTSFLRTSLATVIVLLLSGGTLQAVEPRAGYYSGLITTRQELLGYPGVVHKSSARLKGYRTTDSGGSLFFFAAPAPGQIQADSIRRYSWNFADQQFYLQFNDGKTDALQAQTLTSTASSLSFQTKSVVISDGTLSTYWHVTVTVRLARLRGL